MKRTRKIIERIGSKYTLRELFGLDKPSAPVHEVPSSHEDDTEWKTLSDIEELSEFDPLVRNQKP